MPNWCSNELRVTKQDETAEAIEQFQKFRGFVRNAALPASDPNHAELFQQSYPMPEVVRSTVSGSGLSAEQQARRDAAKAETGHSDWYSWACDNWGTKWDACDLSVNCDDDDDIEVYFETAWSPPEAWLTKMRELYPLLEFWLFFREDGVEAAGYL